MNCSVSSFSAKKTDKVLGGKGQIRSYPMMYVVSYPGDFGIFLSTMSKTLIVLHPDV